MSAARQRLVERSSRPENGHRHARVAIAGATGSGKSTLARRLGHLYGLPYIEMDALYYGPGWSPREDFIAAAEVALAGDRWITDWQYEAVTPRILARAQLVIWLDYSLSVTLTSTLLRSCLRKLHHEILWAGNREGRLLSPSILWDRRHLLRYALRGRAHVRRTLARALDHEGPVPRLWRFESPAALSNWLQREQERARRRSADT